MRGEKHLCAVMTGHQGDKYMHIFFGQPVGTKTTNHGSIELFCANTLVGYRIKNGPHGRSFLFRVVAQKKSESSATGPLQKVPGVMPAVSVLIDRMSDTQRNRLVKVILYLRKKGIPPESMSDRFYFRAATLIQAKQFNIHDIESIL